MNKVQVQCKLFQIDLFLKFLNKSLNKCFTFVNNIKVSSTHQSKCSCSEENDCWENPIPQFQIHPMKCYLIEIYEIVFVCIPHPVIDSMEINLKIN
jgi:hypothetical protein